MVQSFLPPPPPPSASLNRVKMHTFYIHALDIVQSTLGAFHWDDPDLDQ